MIKTLGAAAILAMTTATLATAEPISVANLEVTAEFTDMDSAALEFWPNIEADIGTALAAEVVGLLGTAAQDVSVRILELGLDGSPISATGEFNHMKARVIARPEGTTDTTADFEVELLAGSAPLAGISPDAIIIPPVEGEFYAALVASFASTVADELAQIDTVNAAQSGVFEETESANDDDDDTSGDGMDDGGTGTDDGPGTDDGTDTGTEDGTGTDTGTDTGGTDDGSDTDAGESDDGAVTE